MGVPPDQESGLRRALPRQRHQHPVPGYPTLFQGGIRSNVDLRWHGRNVIRVYPSREEGLAVKGDITYAAARNNDPNTAPPQVVIQVMEDNQNGPNGAIVPPDTGDIDPANDKLLADPLNAAPTASPFSRARIRSGRRPSRPRPRLLWPAGRGQNIHQIVRDNRHSTDNPGTNPASNPARDVRLHSAPDLDQIDAVTGVSRWLRLTRDSGPTLQVPDGNGGTRLVNTGWYGLTDSVDAVRHPGGDPAAARGDPGSPAAASRPRPYLTLRLTSSTATTARP